MMNIQVQPYRRYSKTEPLAPSSLQSKQTLFFHDDITEKIGSTRAKIAQQSSDKQKKHHDLPNLPNLYDYLCPTRYMFPYHRSQDMWFINREVSKEDAITVSSDISLHGDDGESEHEVWNIRDYYQQQDNTDHRSHSWTIHIYNRNHLAGDTVWFRAWFNDGLGYRELEDTEILDLVAVAVQVNPDFCFYVKTKPTGSDTESVSFFESNLIYRVMSLILEQAKYYDGIEIPSMLVLSPKRGPLRQKKQKRCFLSWFFWGKSRNMPREFNDGQLETLEI